MVFSKAALKAVALAAGVVTASANTLNITVQGSLVTLDETDQVDYDQGQNSNAANIVFENNRVKLDGNMWKAFEVPGGVEVSTGTILRFTFDLHETADFQAICLDENLELSPNSGSSDFASGRRCFGLAQNEETQSWVSSLIYVPHLVMPEDDPMQFLIPIGHYFEGPMTYIAFLQDNDEDRTTLGLSEFYDIEIIDQETTMLAIESMGKTVNVPAHPQLDYYISNPYDQDSRFWIIHVSEDGKSVQMSGNQYKALRLPTGDSIDIGIGTMLEFDFSLTDLEEYHAICLDEDTQIKNPDDSEEKRCFMLAGTQNWDKGIHVPDEAVTGTPHHYKIPIGLYFRNMTANFIAFVQDNDSSDKSTGKSTISNIRIYDVPRPSLNISVYGSEMIITNTQIEYNKNGRQDTLYYPLEVSSDGKTVDLDGNIHRAVELPEPVNITEATELDFDFTLNELSEYHAICLEEDLSHSSSRCFATAWTESNSFHKLDQTAENETEHYNVRVGLKYTGTFKYLVFLQDNDEGDKSGGSSSFSNIVISERPPLRISGGGTAGGATAGAATANGLDSSTSGEILLHNHQLTYESTSQDTRDNLMVVSEDSNSVSMRGNLWKALAIPGGLVVTDETVLQFEFMLTEETEIHSICLDEDLDDDTGARCFKLAGTQTDNLGNGVIYRNIQPTHEGEEYSYMIKLSEHFKGTMNYIVFMQDNDSSDRTTGESTFSNIKVFEPASCLADIDFDFNVGECTAKSFTSEIQGIMTANGCVGDPWAELLALFGVYYEHQVRDRIGEICSSAHGANYLPFNEVTGKESQFTAEYLDGGTVWNYGHETELGGGQALSKAASKVEEVHQAIEASPRGISWPDVHNFHGCELRAAMCCFVSRREVLIGDPEMDDNSDACYMDFSKARQSSHVRDGYSIYGNGTEGNLNCHGFAWGNDVGYADSAFKGNNLFEVAMKKKLYDNGFVEELPGAPLCGCIEQMPVVTKAACTKVEAVQTVAVKYVANTCSFSAEVGITSITHSDCNDLSDYYGHLVEEGKATAREKALLDKHLVGGDSCDAALGSFLESKGFVWPV